MSDGAVAKKGLLGRSRALRISVGVLGALAGLVLIFVTVTVGIYFYLQTPSGSQAVLDLTRDRLRQVYGTEIEFEKGRIDVFRGFDFQNLRITKKPAGDAATTLHDARITIDQLKINYRLSIWARSITITELLIVNPHITAHMDLRQQTPEPESRAQQDPFAALEDLILNPPINLVMTSAQITGATIDIERLGPPMETAEHVRAVDQSISFDLKLVSGEFASRGHVNTDQLQTSKGFTLKSRSPLLEMDFNAKVQGRWDLKFVHDVTTPSPSWFHDVNGLDLEATLSNLVVLSRPEAGSSPNPVDTTLRVTEMNLGAHGRVKARTSRLFTIGQGSLANQAVETAELKVPITLLDLVVRDQARKSSAGSPLPDQELKDIRVARTEFGLESVLDRDLQNVVKLEFKGLHLPKTLQRPVDASFNASVNLPRTLTNALIKGSGDIAKHRLINFNLEAQLGETKQIAGQADVNVRVRDFASLLKSGSSLKKMGDLQAKADFKVTQTPQGASLAKIVLDLPKFKPPTLPHSASLRLDADVNLDAAKEKADLKGDLIFKSVDYGDWKIQTELETQFPLDAKTGETLLRSRGSTTVTQSKATSLLPAEIKKPATLTHDIDLVSKTQTVTFKGVFPSLLLTGLGHASGTTVELTARSPKLKVAEDVEVTASVTQSSLNQTLAKSISEISGIKGQLKARIENQNRATLDELHISLAKPYLRFNAQGTGDVARKTMALRSVLEVKFPKNFSPSEGQTVEGQMMIPSTVSLLNGRDLTVEGYADLLGLNWQKGDLQASGISGRVPFSEKLRWNGTHLKFAHLISQNPFERVDFERVRPLLQSAEQLRIRELGWHEKRYGPFIGFFSVRQNMLFAHQFDLDIGKGRIFGEIFFNAFPANLELGLLSRITGLDLNESLPQKFLKRVPKGDARISARSGFTLNVNRSVLNGRVDVTELGGAQLIALINILDPLYEDERMNKMRTLLQVGYPTGVEMAFANGYMNMDINLRALGLSQRQSVRGIPITSLLSKATEDLVKTAEKGPIK